jgi:hypothetical protein
MQGFFVQEITRNQYAHQQPVGVLQILLSNLIANETREEFKGFFEPGQAKGGRSYLLQQVFSKPTKYPSDFHIWQLFPPD